MGTSCTGNLFVPRLVTALLVECIFKKKKVISALLKFQGVVIGSQKIFNFKISSISGVQICSLPKRRAGGNVFLQIFSKKKATKPPKIVARINDYRAVCGQKKIFSASTRNIRNTCNFTLPIYANLFRILSESEQKVLKMYRQRNARSSLVISCFLWPEIKIFF